MTLAVYLLLFYIMTVRLLMAVSGASSVTLLFLALSPEPAGVALLLLRSEMFLLTVSSSGCPSCCPP